MGKTTSFTATRSPKAFRWPSRLNSWNGSTTESGKGDFQLATVKIPVQNDTRDYARLLHEIIPKEKLLRWYLVKVENEVSVIDAVYHK